MNKKLMQIIFELHNLKSDEGGFILDSVYPTDRDHLDAFVSRIHTEARKELIAEIEKMKLLEVGFSPERLHHKQHHNQIIDSILTHLRDEGRE